MNKKPNRIAGNIKSKSIIVSLPIDLTNIADHDKNTVECENNKMILKNFAITENSSNANEFKFQDPGFHKNDSSIKQEPFQVKSFNIGNENMFPLCLNEWKHYHNRSTTRLISEGVEYDRKTVKFILSKYYNDFNDKKNTIPVHCWHCFQKIQGKPCGIPVKYEKETFFIKGFFCSFNCALTYNYNSPLMDTKIQEQESLIRMLYKLSNDNDTTTRPLKYAPPRESLKIFGGTLTEKEFSENLSTVHLVYEPCVPIVSYLEENTIVPDSRDSREKNDLYLFMK